jgi:protein-disulfide isomerase
MRILLAAAALAAMTIGTGAEAWQDQPVAGDPGDSQSEPAPQPPPAPHRIDEPFGKAWLGAADGDVSLIVFADYACPACRAAQPVIDQLLATDPRLRIVYRILINEEDGRAAALTSLAVAGSGGDWAAFHHALDEAGAPSPTTIAAALAKAGVDPKTLPKLDDESLVDSPIMAELMNNDALIGQRHGTAVPAWVIGGGKALNGFDLARLKAAIAAARAGKRD